MMSEMNQQQNPIFEHNAFDLANSLLDTVAAEPARPEDFGPYRFTQEKPLGCGSMGDVWLAEEEAADRLVAIKVLRNVLDPAVWARREVKRLGKLLHQHVAVL